MTVTLQQLLFLMTLEQHFDVNSVSKRRIVLRLRELITKACISRDFSALLGCHISFYSIHHINISALLHVILSVVLIYVVGEGSAGTLMETEATVVAT